MKLSTLIRLPASLLAVSLSLLVASAPAQVTPARKQSVELNPDNFDVSTATGTWFIKFFSPYCPHCRHFAPMWQELVEDVDAIPSATLNMGEVNCAVYGDLCSRLSIESYPKMNIYQNGEFVETFKKSRDRDLLTEFMAPYLGSATTTDAPESDNTEPPPNPLGELLLLTDQNFQEVISKGHVFIKFYAPWCGHCKKLAPTWLQLAEQMKNQLVIAEVNCEAYGSICRSQDVQGYPMLFYYDEAGAKTEYTGSRKLADLDAFVERLVSPSVQEIAFSDFDSQVQANEVMFLLLHSTSDTQSTAVVTKASSVLLGASPVFVSTSDDLSSNLNIHSNSLPALIVFKDGDAKKLVSMKSLKPEDGVEDVKSWFLRHRLPTVIDLDSDNFQQVMSPKQGNPPLVVIAPVTDDNKAVTKAKLGNIGKKWRENRGGEADKEVVFAHMDAVKWGKWLKGMYGITGLEEAKVSPIVIADHTKLLYWDIDVTGSPITGSTLSTTLEAVIAGSLAYKHSENFVERMARFLNNGLIALEEYVTTNPIKSALFVLCALVLFVLFIRRLLADGDEEAPVVRNGKYEKPAGEYLRKSNRLE